MATSTPLPLEYAVPPPPHPPARPRALFGIAATAVVAGILVGATTNAVNGLVSPAYFINVMGWQGASDVWLRSILQGMLEGSVAGVVLSAIITLTIGIVTRASCSYAAGARCLWRIVLGVYALWIVGGLLGVLLAECEPGFFQYNFIGVPGSHAQMLRYAWVGGSIWGAYFGGPLSMIVLIKFAKNWKRMLKERPRLE